LDRYARFFDIEIRKNGEKIEPKAAVSVRIELEDAPAETDPEALKVVHFAEAGPETVDETKTAQKEDAGVELIFDAESFSVYGVITVPSQPQGVNDLDGRIFTISRSGRYLRTATGDIGNNGNGATGFLKGTEADAATWQFEQVNGSTYYISTIVDGQKKYMHFAEHGSNRADVSLSDNPQEFTVAQANGGYRLSASINGTTYYLDEHNGTDGEGFAGWGGQSDNGILSFNLTQPVLIPNDEYMVIVKRNEDGVDKYYIVRNDGTLQPVQYDESDRSVSVDDPMLWTYTGSNIYHHSMQVAYDGNKLPTDFYYRYIDPTAASGWSEDPTATNITILTPDGQHVMARPQMSATALIYENNRIRSTVDSSQYIGVEEVNGTLKIKGQVSPSDAVEILFADAVKAYMARNRRYGKV